MQPEFTPIPEEPERIAKRVLDAAFHVHKALGPGLLESVYEKCLLHRLRREGLTVQAQVVVPIHYDDLRIEEGLRLDILVENELIVEVKAVDAIHPIHKAQLLTYMKLSNKRLGFLVNFNVPLLKEGITRLVR